jgi:hypothetical protein
MYDLLFLSASLRLCLSGAGQGGERNLPGGYLRIMKVLRNKCVRRSKRDQCYFKIKKGRIVKIIEQLRLTPDGVLRQNQFTNASSTSPPFAVTYCPAAREMYVSHFVVSTVSVGIMRNSIQATHHLNWSYNDVRVLPALVTTERNDDSDHASKCLDGMRKDQQEAAILFRPPLSLRKVEAFNCVCMGTENKVSLVRFAVVGALMCLLTRAVAVLLFTYR